MRFRTTLQLDGKTATGIEVPDDVVTALGAGRRPPVTVSINGFEFDTTLGVRNGVSKIPVSAERREAAGIAAGDRLEVDIRTR